MSDAQHVDIQITHSTYGRPIAMAYPHSRLGHSSDPSGKVLRSAGQPPELKHCPPPVHTFTGRVDILAQMHECFFNSPLTQHIFVLCGLGGAGKTQIALKFVEMCQGETVPRWVQLRSYLGL